MRAASFQSDVILSKTNVKFIRVNGHVFTFQEHVMQLGLLLNVFNVIQAGFVRPATCLYRSCVGMVCFNVEPRVACT